MHERRDFRSRPDRGRPLTQAYSTSRRSIRQRTVLWALLWNPRRIGQGLEHILLSPQAADSMLLGFDEEDRPYRLSYTLEWDAWWQLHTARLAVTTTAGSRTLQLDADGEGHWC